MSETPREFTGWAKVEALGHQTHIGFVQTEYFGSVAMFRVKEPFIEAGPEQTVERRGYFPPIGTIDAGAVFRLRSIPASEVLLGAGSIYRIEPCDERKAVNLIREADPVPFELVRPAPLTADSAAQIDEDMPF